MACVRVQLLMLARTQLVDDVASLSVLDALWLLLFVLVVIGLALAVMVRHGSTDCSLL